MVFKSKAKLDPILGKKGINILKQKNSVHTKHTRVIVYSTHNHTHTKHPGTYCYL